MREAAQPLSAPAAPRRQPGERIAPLRIVSEVAVSVPLDPLLSLKALASYSGLGKRTLQGFLALLPSEALPCYRVGGRVLVRRSVFDRWLERFRCCGHPDLAHALREMGLDKISV